MLQLVAIQQTTNGLDATTSGNPTNEETRENDFTGDNCEGDRNLLKERQD